MLDVTLLGGFEVRWCGHDLSSNCTPHQASILAYLLLHRHRRITRLELASVFWPEAQATQARTNVRKAIHRWRRCLPGLDHVFTLTDQEIGLRSNAPLGLDVARFEDCMDTGSLTELKEAVRLYRGDLLPQCYSDWIEPYRAMLRERFLSALRRLIAWQEAQRNLDEALIAAQRLVNAEPGAEEGYVALMRLYALKGELHAAYSTYRRCKTVLARELGVAPGQAIQELHRRLRTYRTSSIASTNALPPLIGRQQEWAELWRALREGEQGDSRIFLLEGEPGVGKTRLAHELATAAQAIGWHVAYARAYPHEAALPYSPIVQWLRSHPIPRLEPVWLKEVARLVPDRVRVRGRVADVGPLQEPWQRHRFFEALARSVLAKLPCLLVADDLQWFDRDTLEWLSYLLRYATSRLMVLGTVRAGDTDTEPVAEFLRFLHDRRQVKVLPLNPLPEDDVASLASTVIGHSLAPRCLARLHRETGGNPLFLLELLRQPSIGSDGQVPNEGTPWTTATIDTVLQSRISGLSAFVRRLAGLAAAWEGPFALGLLLEAAGEDAAQVVTALDELVRRRIIKVRPDYCYEFTHDRIREAALQVQDPAWTQWCWRRWAQTLAGQADAAAARIAGYWERAGEPLRAVPYYMASAQAALSVHAYGAAVEAFEHLLVLLPLEEQGEILFRLGEVYQRMGRYVSADAAYRRALTTVRDRRMQAWCRTRLGYLMVLKRQHLESLDQLQAALELWEEQGEMPAVSEVLWSLGLAHRYHGEWQQGVEVFGRLVQHARAMDDRIREAQAQAQCALVFRAQGQGVKAFQSLCHALWGARDSGDLLVELRSLAWMAEMFLDQGDNEAGLDCHLLAIERCLDAVSMEPVRPAIERIGPVYWDLADLPTMPVPKDEWRHLEAKLGDVWALATFSGHIGRDCLGLDAIDEAARWFNVALRLEDMLSIPYNRCRYLLGRAETARRQGRRENANADLQAGLAAAQGMHRLDVILQGELWRLHHNPGDRAAAIARAEDLTRLATTSEEKARSHHLLWKLDLARTKDRALAASMFRCLHRRIPRSGYREAYRELTGRSLGAPAPFLWPEELSRPSPDRTDLLRRVEEVATRRMHRGGSIPL